MHSLVDCSKWNQRGDSKQLHAARLPDREVIESRQRWLTN